MQAFRSPLNLVLIAALAMVTAVGFILIPTDKILPIRWGFDLTVTQTAPRNFALLQMPLAALLIWGICWAFLRFGNADRAKRNTRTLVIILPLVTSVFVAVEVLMVVSGLR